MADSAPVETSEEPPRSSGMMTKLVIAGVIGVVILGETGMAFLLTPNPEDVAKRMRDQMREDFLANTPDSDLLDEEDLGPLAEVELGEFNISIHHQAAEATYTISCKVMATVAEDDFAEFEELMEINKFRLREKIMIEFRNANIDDLADSELGLIKRRISEKSNALFGKPLIKSVLLPDFNYYQQ